MTYNLGSTFPIKSYGAKSVGVADMLDETQRQLDALCLKTNPQEGTPEQLTTSKVTA